MIQVPSCRHSQTSGLEICSGYCYSEAMELFSSVFFRTTILHGNTITIISAIYYTFNTIQSQASSVCPTPPTMLNKSISEVHEGGRLCSWDTLQTLSVHEKRESRRDRETWQHSAMSSEVKACKKTKKRSESIKEENESLNTDTGVLPERMIDTCWAAWYRLLTEITKMDPLTVSMIRRWT